MNESIDLSGVSETLLVPVYARAIESKKDNPAFVDETALKVIDNMNYEFKKKFENTQNKMNMWGCSARTIIFDRETKKFIENNPDCSVINLASGLDDRFTRVDNGQIKWYNIDFEEVINLRKQLIPENDRVINIASSALDFSWIDLIENKNEVLVIAEGFLMYLDENEVKNLFNKIYESFNNVQLQLELMSNWMVNNQKVHATSRQMDVEFKWGLEESEDFEKLCSYKMLDEYNFTDEMKRFSPIFIRIISPFLRKRNNRMAKFDKI